MNRDILMESLKYNLRKMSLIDFSRLFINEIQAIEEFYKLCHGIKAGNTISLLFNPHRLCTDNEKDDISVFESLQYDDKISGLARLYLYNLEQGVNNPFYGAVQRGYQNIQYVNEFPPFVARTICQLYGKNKEKLNVLDPCAGWGGRMIGCASIGNIHYTACEPSTATYNGLIRLGNWLQQLQPSFKFTVLNIPYEEYVSDKKFDVALTSPPYYDTEHYSNEETNSWIRYNDFDSWIDGFYKPLILNTVCRIDGGVFVLNVGDRKYPLSENLYSICQEHHIYVERIRDYLSGNGAGKEKFYCLSEKPIKTKPKKLF